MTRLRSNNRWLICCYGFQATVLLIVRMLAANEPYIHAPHYGPAGLRKLLTFLNSPF